MKIVENDNPLKEFQDLMNNKQIKECLWCGTTEDIVKAHSIQRSIIEKIEDKNREVYCIESNNIKNEDLSPRFKKVRTKSFSTFTGFCGKHDNEIFYPIENNFLYTGTDEQNYLFAFRSLSKELHGLKEAQILNAKKKDRIQQYLIKQGITDPDKHLHLIDPDMQMRFSKISYDLNLKEFESMKNHIINRNFNDLYSIKFELNAKYDIVANSIFIPYRSPLDGNYIFSLDERKKINEGEMNPHIYFNLFPQNDKTYIIFSCHKENRQYLDKFLSNINENHPCITYIITLLLIMYVENVGFSTSIIDRLEEESKQIIIDIFHSNLYSPEDFDFDYWQQKSYNLFGAVLDN